MTETIDINNRIDKLDLECRQYCRRIELTLRCHRIKFLEYQHKINMLETQIDLLCNKINQKNKKYNFVIMVLHKKVNKLINDNELNITYDKLKLIVYDNYNKIVSFSYKNIYYLIGLLLIFFIVIYII